MRIELHPVFNVHIVLEDLRNVDLATRGYYQVRLVPKPSSLFSCIDIQYVEAANGYGGLGVLSPSVLSGTGISRSVELTYIDETLTIGDSFVVSLRLGPHADLSSTYHLSIDVELWSMDRHRPPNLTLFELESKRTIEICLRPAHLTAAARHLFFEHPAYAILAMTVYASLVSVLPRRRRQPPDPTIDTKSKNVHLSTGSTLLRAMSSIEQFVIRNQKGIMASVHMDICDVSAEMEILKTRIEATTNPWNEVENMVVNLSARLSLLYSQLVRLCIGSSAVSSMLLQEYKKFREKMLSEAFFFMENTPFDLSKYNSLEKMFSIVSRSKYLEKIPRFPIFCFELDSSATNWCLVVEHRFLPNIHNVFNGSKLAEMNTASASIETAGHDIQARHGSLHGSPSRFPWLRRKSTNGRSRSLVQTDVRQATLFSPSDHLESSSPSDENFNSIVDFVLERERLKATLFEQKLFDGYLYSEQATPWRYELPRSQKQPTHLVVFVHGLEGTCDDLSSYRNIFRVAADNISGFIYLLSASNHSKTWFDFDEMADNLLSEIQSYVSRYSELPARISFIAHSLGGIIVRTAVSREDALDWLVPRLHCLLTINSPHLGLAYVGKGVNLGIQFMQWWKQSRSMEQLSLKDEVLFSNSFLYRLSKKSTFGLFRCVLLIGSPADMFVPCHSALLSPCKSANKDPSALGTAVLVTLPRPTEPDLSAGSVKLVEYVEQDLRECNRLEIITALTSRITNSSKKNEAARQFAYVATQILLRTLLLRDMLSNVHDDIVSSSRTTAAIRYSTWHTISSPNASRFTGRATHIAAVEDDVFIEKLFTISALKYFTE